MASFADQPSPCPTVNVPAPATCPQQLSVITPLIRLDKEGKVRMDRELHAALNTHTNALAQFFGRRFAPPTPEPALWLMFIEYMSRKSRAQKQRLRIY